MVLPSQMHSTRVQSPSLLSTSFLPRVSISSLKSGSCMFHQSCRPVKRVFSPPVFHRGFLSGPITTSLVNSTGISLLLMGIRSPTHPCANWHSIDAIHVPPVPPSGPVPCRRMPELRTYLP